MKTRVLSILVLMLLLSCSPQRPYSTLIGTTLKDIAISIAIHDFTTNCYLFERDSVFCVAFEDSVFNKPTLIRVNDNKLSKHTHEWVRGEFLDGEVCVVIGGSTNIKYSLADEYRGGLPTRYTIRDNKLFYWKDDRYPITEETIRVLWQYDLLIIDNSVPELLTDDNQKGAHYYFCKNDLSKYKRRITDIGFGYYKPPRLKCR